jgi:hypothetical protein
VAQAVQRQGAAPWPGGREWDRRVAAAYRKYPTTDALLAAALAPHRGRRVSGRAGHHEFSTMTTTTTPADLRAATLDALVGLQDGAAALGLRVEGEALSPSSLA